MQIDATKAVQQRLAYSSRDEERHVNGFMIMHCTRLSTSHTSTNTDHTRVYNGKTTEE